MPTCRKIKDAQLKEDIKVAKENNFGRKVFEAFAGEYMSSHLAEGTEVRKLQKELETVAENSADTESKLKEKDAEIEAVQMKLRIAEDKNVREKALTELTANLSKDKRRVMNELLESVQTSDLKKQFNKYLPAVLNESAPAVSNIAAETHLDHHLILGFSFCFQNVNTFLIFSIIMSAIQFLIRIPYVRID